MGFRFRKSVKAGPFRINFSKSGIGYSFGGKGFRVTKKAGGGTRTTASIPGTGISYVKDHGSGKKKASGSAPASSGKTGSTEAAPKKPIYQRPWFVAVIVIILLSAVGSACSGDDDAPDDDPVDQQEETLPAEDQAVDSENTEAPEETLENSPEEPSESTKDPTEELQDAPQKQDPVQDESQAPPESTSANAESQESTGSAPVVVTPPASTPAPEPQPEPAPVVDSTPEPESKPAQETSRTVYITKTGKRYHFDGNCGNGEYIPSTLAEAEARGLTPCAKCVGG